ncbi:hypothetical protein AAXB25_14785 [Paenibacillus lautus]|uniref:hypothetical protein n=1 Tax=Paenibacillus lautus TaxID=1401 RepID=UPI003D270EBB
MSKQELIQKVEAGELKPQGVSHITNTIGIAVCHIEHGVDDKVFGYITMSGKKQYFYVKLHYLVSKIIFRIGNMTFDIGQFIRA